MVAPITKEPTAPRPVDVNSGRPFTDKLATISNSLSLLLVLSCFTGVPTVSATLDSSIVRLAAAAGLCFIVHASLLYFAPPEQQRLSSLILVMIGGALTPYLALLMWW